MPTLFLSTPSARRATHGLLLFLPDISISIHALREEGDKHLKTVVILLILFLSTPSARRATCFQWLHRFTGSNFYPRPPRGGRLAKTDAAQGVEDISIHALREEGDIPDSASFCPWCGFLSTPSARRATCTPMCVPRFLADFYPRPPRGGRPNTDRLQGLMEFISIHALREEGDAGRSSQGRSPDNFYPRPPRGGRRASMPATTRAKNFYPRPPRGGRRP